MQVWAQGYDLDTSTATAELFTLLLQVLPRLLPETHKSLCFHSTDIET